MPKPKFLKPLLIGCACALPIGLVVGLSVNWEHRQFISSLGSSGVKPFVEAFAKTYHNAHTNTDVIVEAGGSNYAIEQLSKGLTNIGNNSNNPWYVVNRDGYKDKWDNKKTFTLGYEGVVMMYNLPSGIENKDAFKLAINENNILDLYAVFSGFNESWMVDNEGNRTVYKWTKDEAKEKASMYHYLTKESKDKLSDNDLQKAKDTAIIPYVRSGGNTNANSSIAFTYYSNLFEKFDDFETSVTPNQLNAFTGGQYGRDRYCHETEEANARAYELFHKDNLPGAMTFLTSGFIIPEGNQKMIKKAGYKFAGYKPRGTNQIFKLETKQDLDKLCLHQGGYNWFRPINCMIDLNNKKSKDFVYWIYFGSEKTPKDFCPEYKTTMRNNGAKELNTQQFISMLDLDAAFFNDKMFGAKTSDLEIEKIRKKSSEENAKIYGALQWDL